MVRGEGGYIESDNVCTQDDDFVPTQQELTQLEPINEDSLPPPSTPISPLELPWGRFLPCSRHKEASSSGKENGVDFLPRRPGDASRRVETSRCETRTVAVSFLGLDDLRASDRFNEYVVGRSPRCDVVSLECPRFPWVHTMVSNRHCRVFCCLTGVDDDGAGAVGMEVYVEDSSGNGTFVNNTTLLRRGEKRLLHTGDEICLINPATLRKRVSSMDVQRTIQQHYSYIFVNVHQQQVNIHQHFLMNPLSTTTTTTTKRRGIVDVKQTNSNPTKNENKPSSNNAPINNNDNNNKPAEGIGFAQKWQEMKEQPKRRIEEFYDLRDLLGSGTCGDVRRAIHRRTGEQMAVKVINLGTTGRNRAHARKKETEATLKAEASILRSLDHPYIVKLVDLFLSPNAVYLVMEMVHGGDLFDRIVEKERYSEVESRRIMRRILSAVVYLHEERDVVHRDLKPENILCVNRLSDVEVKLTDFGLAKAVTNGDGLKTFCGTPQYFAPEVLRRRHTIAGKGRYGKEADMWSLGVILYILLSGAPPFDVTNSIDIVAEAKIEFDGRRWEGISSGAKRLVRSLLTADPRKRINVLDACRDEWILTDDGDTHRHPLDDPRLKKKNTSTKSDLPDEASSSSAPKVASPKQSVSLSSESASGTTFGQRIRAPRSPRPPPQSSPGAVYETKRNQRRPPASGDLDAEPDDRETTRTKEHTNETNAERNEDRTTNASSSRANGLGSSKAESTSKSKKRKAAPSRKRGSGPKKKTIESNDHTNNNDRDEGMELPDDKIVSDFSDEDVEDVDEGTLRASEDAAEGSKAQAAPSKTASDKDNNDRAESNQKARSKADENHDAALRESEKLPDENKKPARGGTEKRVEKDRTENRDSNAVANHKEPKPSANKDREEDSKPRRKSGDKVKTDQIDSKHNETETVLKGGQTKLSTWFKKK